GARRRCPRASLSLQRLCAGRAHRHGRAPVQEEPRLRGLRPGGLRDRPRFQPVPPALPRAEGPGPGRARLRGAAGTLSQLIDGKGIAMRLAPFLKSTFVRTKLAALRMEMAGLQLASTELAARAFLNMWLRPVRLPSRGRLGVPTRHVESDWM